MYREQRVACELRVEQVPRKDQSFNQILRHLVYTFEQTRKETQTATWAMLKWRWFFFSVYLLDCQTKTFHSPSVTLEHDTLPVRIPAWCQDILYSTDKLLSKVDKRKHLTMLHSQLTNHSRLLIDLWRRHWRAYIARSCCLAMSVWVMAILPYYLCSQLDPTSPTLKITTYVKTYSYYSFRFEY